MSKLREPLRASKQPAPGKLGMYLQIDKQSSPRLYAALAGIKEGKPRAQRLRDLALSGLTLELLSDSIHALPQSSTGVRDGAEGVFDDPLD